MIARVYQAINAVGAALAQDGVAKTRLNSRDNYMYRSIDDVLGRLAPLLAIHRLCILPRVVERTVVERQGETGGLLISVALRVAFDLVSAEDGSSHTIEAYGEAIDAGDKATAKAMQSAYKYAVLQVFCVPAIQLEDADASSHRLTLAALPAEPAKGWPQWADELVVEIEACASTEAIRQLQVDHRTSLAALSRERPDLYRALGEAIALRKVVLHGTAVAPAPPVRASLSKAADCAVAKGEVRAAMTLSSERTRRGRQKATQVATPPPGNGSLPNGSGPHV
jgi:hypothetical protein